jgi:hypothetical protein
MKKGTEATIKQFDNRLRQTLHVAWLSLCKVFKKARNALRTKACILSPQLDGNTEVMMYAIPQKVFKLARTKALCQQGALWVQKNGGETSHNDMTAYLRISIYIKPRSNYERT